MSEKYLLYPLTGITIKRLEIFIHAIERQANESLEKTIKECLFSGFHFPVDIMAGCTPSYTVITNMDLDKSGKIKLKN